MGIYGQLHLKEVSKNKRYCYMEIKCFIKIPQHVTFFFSFCCSWLDPLLGQIKVRLLVLRT